MKFKGEPNQLVRITKIRPHLIRKMPKSIRFDKDGIYETDNLHLIKRLSTRYEEVKEKIEVEKEIKEKQEIFKCKKCNFKTTNKGELLAHYRKHKK